MALIKHERKCGNSTRQIDEWVQELFTNRKVYICDHAHKQDIYGSATNFATRHSLNTLYGRLFYEHNIKKEDLHYDGRTRILSFANE